MQSYQNDAVQTRSPGFHPERVKYTSLLSDLEQFAMWAESIDKLKRLLFYADPKRRAHEVKYSSEKIPDLSADMTDVLHAALGLATEAGEIVEAVLSVFEIGGVLDRTNLVEEAGDVHWYLALLQHAIGTDEATVQEKNLAKLRARYKGGAFTAAEAADRDLAAERAVLESEEG